MAVRRQFSKESFRVHTAGGRHTLFQVMQKRLFKAVLQIRIRIRRIHMILGLLDPDPDPLVRGMDPYPDPALDPDPSIIKQK
jgi:hypothetical protein